VYAGGRGKFDDPGEVDDMDEDEREIWEVTNVSEEKSWK
jgi:hypothetical protein